MKMRDELELYKGKSAELESKIVFINDANALERDALVITHNIEVSELTEKHKKVLEQKENSIVYRTNDVTKLTEQVNNMHDILDVIPGVLPRKKDDSYSTVETPCHVRLASVLAQKFM